MPGVVCVCYIILEKQCITLRYVWARVEQKHDGEICYIQNSNLSHSDNGVIYYGNHENWEWMKPSNSVGSTYSRKRKWRNCYIYIYIYISIFIILLCFGPPLSMFGLAHLCTWMWLV
jgi:hypothetical protein